MSDELILKVDVQGAGETDNLDKKINNVGKTTNKTQTELQKLRNELKNAKNDMLAAEEGTDAYNSALRRASDAQFKLRDINDKTRAAVRDFGTTGKNVAQSVAGLAGGFSVLTGAMALFGVENDLVAQTILKVQAAMSIASGIGQFADSIDSMKDLISGLRTEFSPVSGAITELSNVTDEAADSVKNLGKETAVITSNIAGSASAIDNTNKKLGDTTTKIDEQFEKLSKRSKDSGKDLRDFHNAEIELGKEQSLLGNSTNNLTKNNEELNKSVTKGSSSIGKQLLTIGLWVAAITLAVIGIVKLIEWINKIPEDVKIKIDIEAEALEQTKKVQTDIIKLGKDYELALKKNDTERLKLLDDISKKEYGLNDQQLKLIKLRTDGWREAFKEYLKMAEDTYYNEAIIKKGVEAQITGKQALSRARNLFENQVKKNQGNISKKAKQILWTGYVKAAQDGSFTRQMEEALFVYGVDQQIIDELRTVSEQNAIIRSLPKLREVYTTKLKDTTGGGGRKKYEKTKITVGLGILPTTPTELEEEKIAWEEFIKRNKTYVEMATSGVAKEMTKIGKLGANPFQLILADIRLLNAELLDNEIETKKVTDKLNGYADAQNNFNEKNTLYKKAVTELNEDYKEEAKLKDELNKLIKQEIDNNEVAKNKQQELINVAQLALNTKQAEIKSKEENIKTMLDELNILSEGSKEYKTIYDKLIELGISRDKIEEELAQKRRDRFREELKMVTDQLNSFSDLASGMSDLYQGNMDLINAEYDAKIWANDEMNQSDELREQNAYRIEMERYNALKENFEMQKKMKEAQAWMDFASGSVGIWTAPGITSLAPFGYILAATQQAALLASTIGNVKTIRSQQLEKPHSPNNSGNGTASGSATIPALNPVQNALTTKEENLNMMYNSNNQKQITNVVKVTDINNVQNNVKVRERITTY